MISIGTSLAPECRGIQRITDELFAALPTRTSPHTTRTRELSETIRQHVTVSDEEVNCNACYAYLVGKREEVWGTDSSAAV